MKKPSKTLTRLRQATTRTQSDYEDRDTGRGHRKMRPITLPPMPWDKKPDADQDDGDK